MTVLSLTAAHWQGESVPAYHLSYPFPLVILSEAKDLTRWAEMLRCTQHDSTLPDCHAEIDAYYRRIPDQTTTKKHVHKDRIAVLTTTAQNERYVSGIFANEENIDE
jgi:hypothetical protein